MNDLKEILRLDREDLVQAFRKASVAGRGTPEHVADDRDTALREVLGRYFPYPYFVVKGNISDSNGSRSASVDAIVVNPVHPHTMLPGRSPFFLAAEGVDYAIELKPDLGNHAEIERALGQMQTVKKLKRATDGPLVGSGNRLRRRPCCFPLPLSGRPGARFGRPIASAHSGAFNTS